MNGNRVKRSRTELEQALREQLELLQFACDSYDSGKEVAGKHISLTLRILLHHIGRSRSLLEQLGLRNNWFYDESGRMDPNNYFSDCTLVATHVQLGKDARHVPKCNVPSAAKFMRHEKLPFAEWWNVTVCRDRSQGLSFSRFGLVSNVADTDGGAHVDPELDAHYEALTRRGGFPWVEVSWNLGNGEVFVKLLGRPELACMRQIAHEVLVTLHERAPQYF